MGTATFSTDPSFFPFGQTNIYPPLRLKGLPADLSAVLSFVLSADLSGAAKAKAKASSIQYRESSIVFRLTFL
jgi:hypothetical protein